MRQKIVEDPIFEHVPLFTKVILDMLLWADSTDTKYPMEVHMDG